MHRAFLLALVVLGPFVAVIPASNQNPQTPAVQRPGAPPRDNVAAAKSTGRVRGRVVATDGGAPLRRAQVTISASEPALRRFTTTDGDGRYEFAELPDARYTISVSKGGYVPLQYGQRRPFEPGRPLALANGQTLTQVDVALPRGSVITGRITDEFGEPVTGAQIQAQRYQYGPGGVRRLAFAGNFGFNTTDDLGQFRLFGLMPGEYVVSATIRSFTGPATGPGSAGDSSEGYPPTFYPGTANAADAEAVNVVLGQDLSIQFALAPSRMMRISGTIVDSQGRAAAGATVNLRTGSSGGFVTSASFGQVQADGSFTIPSVTPGEYVLDVRAQRRPAALDNPADVAQEFASLPVVVGGSDVVGLRIATGTGARVTGRVILEGTSSTTGGFGPLRVLASSADPQGGVMLGMVGGDALSNGTVADDGGFQIRGIAGKVLFRVGAPPAWSLKSVSLNGDDITDTPFEIKGIEVIEDLRVVLTDRLTDVSGGVVDGRRAAVKDYAVVVQPAEPVPGMAATRYVRVARPDQDGRFRVRGMPPGRYVATAVEALEQGREWDPDFQLRLRERGRSLSIAEDEKLTLDLTLVEGL